jgi:hypothetical protein
MMSLRGRSKRSPCAKNLSGHYFETVPDAAPTGDCFPVERGISLLVMTSLANRTKNSTAGMKPRPSTLFFTRLTVSHNRAICSETDLAPAP